MIEYLVAFLAGTAVALVLARVGSKKLSVDEVLERVDDKLELVKRIPAVSYTHLTLPTKRIV